MLETDAVSRRHLLFIVGFLAFLFGGFALWGTVEKAIERGSFGGFGSIGDPAPVGADRAAFLAERRKQFQTRKQMAVSGKAGDWRGAVRIADTYLARNEDANIRLLRGEALFRLGDNQGGIAMAEVSGGEEGEAELLRGRTRDYEQKTRDAIRRTDENKATALDANNTAWLAAFTPVISEPELLTKAVALAEKAVRSARSGEDAQAAGELATYTNTLGGVYFRAGRDREAITTLLESEKMRPDPFNAAFLTLAYRRAGNTAAETTWRDRLETHLDDTYATRDGQLYRHQLLLLWREIADGKQE